MGPDNQYQLDRIYLFEGNGNYLLLLVKSEKVSPKNILKKNSKIKKKSFPLLCPATRLCPVGLMKHMNRFSYTKDANTVNTNFKLKMLFKPATTFRRLSSHTWKGVSWVNTRRGWPGVKEELEWRTKWNYWWLCVCQWSYQSGNFSNKLRGAFLANTNKILRS